MSETDDILGKSPPAPEPPAEPSPDTSVVSVGRPDGAAEKPETGHRIEIPDEIPILPIRQAVAFPGTIMPLAIGRDKSRRAIDAALTGNKLLGVVAQIRAETDDPALDELYRVGTVCVVLKLLNMPDGTQSIIVHGLVRFGIEEVVADEPYIRARIGARFDQVTESPELVALAHTVRKAANRVIELLPNVPSEASVVLNNLDTPGALADFLAANLSMDVVHKQELLETFDVLERLRKVYAEVTRQLEMLELSRKIEDETKGRIEKQQRDYFLHEQMKAIQKELGESDARTSEIEGLRQRIEQAKMPPDVAREAHRELERMARIPQASPEYSVALDYVTWLCELPWAVSTPDSLDLARAERILNADHYDLEKIKQRILEFLAVRKLKPDGRGPILCFVGPPGVGKTSLGQSIARALGRKFIRMSLGGIRDEADIRGHRRTYIGALPGRIIQEIRKAGSNNPVFMLDEVDKIGQDFRGDPASALLEVLDPQQNYSFTDHYLDVPFDLSKTMFIATANYTDPIPPALYDRMEVITLPGYTQAQKLHIARRYLVPRQLSEHGLKPERLSFTDGALKTVIAAYTREAGVRNLEREIGTVCRAVAARVARGNGRSVTLTPRGLVRYLGPPRFLEETVQRTSVPGVVTGLAFTPTGGDLIFVEAAAMPGKGNLVLTGQLGNVMKESAQAAHSLLKSRARSLRIPDKALSEQDIHIHVPAGAVPKDGPSAGVSMYTAMVSLLTGRPCRSDVAMTGEITLRGLVLPIGGVKEKTLAAHRAGIRTVILPERNRKDLADVPLEVRKRVKFVFAERVETVVQNALTERADRTDGGPAARRSPTKAPVRRAAARGERRRRRRKNRP